METAFPAISRKHLLEVLSAEEEAKDQEMRGAVALYLDLVDKIQALVLLRRPDAAAFFPLLEERKLEMFVAVEAWRIAARRHWEAVMEES